MPVIASTSSRWPLPWTPAIPKISPARTSSETWSTIWIPRSSSTLRLPDLQHGTLRLGRGLLDLEHHVATDHEVGEALLGRFLRVGGADDLAAPKHGHAVGDREHLPELVRDEDDRLALVDERLHDGEELVDLAWGEHRGRLVEDQDVGLAEQRLDQLDALLFADRQVAHHRGGVDRQAVGTGELVDALRHQGGVEEAAAPGHLVAEHHVLGDGEHRDQLEVLVHHPDAACDRVPGARHLDRLTTQQDLSGVGLVQPEHGVDERALAGTVLAEQAMDLARVQRQADVLVGDHPRERLGEPPHLQNRHAATIVAVAERVIVLVRHAAGLVHRATPWFVVAHRVWQIDRRGDLVGPRGDVRPSDAGVGQSGRPVTGSTPVSMLPAASPTRISSTWASTSAGTGASCGGAKVIPSFSADSV